MKDRLLVTGYVNPDLDATACAVAYSEYLQKTGTDAVAGVFGSPSAEARFVISFFQIQTPPDASPLVKDIPSVVLVDASDLRGLAKDLKPEQVVEIIDHRSVHQADQFPHAQIQIELVGSAATLIAEKFSFGKVEISEQSAALLYSAIISNTVNFQANVTTERDQKMANWLVDKLKLPADYIHQMFVVKSQFTKPLKEELVDDLATFDFGGHTLGIAQLEIVAVTNFVEQRRAEIDQALLDIKDELGLEYIFLTCIDVERATNTFVVVDDAAQDLVAEALGVVFHDLVAQKEGIMMRKTIVPLVKGSLEKDI